MQRFAVAFGLVVATLVATTGAGLAGTLDDVRARDRLICGVSEGLRGFSEQDGAGAWHGLDVDFCRAVAAAVLGDPAKVDFVPLSAAARFGALTEGKIDLLSRNSTWTMTRDLELGLDFPGTSYFDGQGFLVPTIFGAISPLEFNPYWNVPAGLAAKEERPKLQSNPASVAAAGFEVVRGDQVYDVRQIDWAQVSASRFPFQLRQKPGENNALGRVKFMFPNPHDVYLHDTPSRSLFGWAERAFSHGCIRLSRPLDLAYQVLEAGGVADWSSARIDGVVASLENTVVNLETPMPVHITYLTAWVEANGVHFSSDIYGHDEKLLAALDGKSLAW